MDGYNGKPTMLMLRGEGVQDVEYELSWVKCKFEIDRFTDIPVYTARLVRQGKGVVIWLASHR